MDLKENKGDGFFAGLFFGFIIGALYVVLAFIFTGS